MNSLFIILGFGALIVGGEYLVRGAAALALRLHISPVVIGLTLVGFGTSVPELVTSLQAAFAGSPGIAVGNVVGSNIANSLLILGIAALVAPLAVAPDVWRRDGGVMVAASVLCLWAVTSGTLGRGAGGVFVLGLAGYMIATLWNARQIPVLAIAEPMAASRMYASLSFAGGLTLTLFGAKLLVTGAIGLAQVWGLSEAVIGLTVVAVGTSLPELVTSVVAARRGQSALAIGNVIGSNIFNILGILGVTALARPLDIPTVIAQVDIWVMLAATLAIIVFARTWWRIGRIEGGSLLAGYCGYLLWCIAGL